MLRKFLLSVNNAPSLYYHLYSPQRRMSSLRVAWEALKWNKHSLPLIKRNCCECTVVIESNSDERFQHFDPLLSPLIWVLAAGQSRDVVVFREILGVNQLLAVKMRWARTGFWKVRGTCPPYPPVEMTPLHLKRWKGAASSQCLVRGKQMACRRQSTEVKGARCLHAAVTNLTLEH